MKHVEMIIDYVTDGTDFEYCDNHGVLTRCRDCKHYCYTDNRIPQEQWCACDISEGTWHPDDFCSYGERREESE